MTKKFLTTLAFVLLAFCSAVNYSVFVFPNSFAPAGIDGVFTMIQDVFHINMGYLSFVANIPLLMIAFFLLNRGFAIKSSVYVLSFSLSLILLKTVDISSFYYSTETSIVLAPIVAGTIRGILYYATLKLNGSSGGIDIIASLLKRRNPHYNLMNTIFCMNLLVALSSYFVYGMKIEPVICSIIYSLITSSISNKIHAIKSETVKFEIITPDAERLCADISSKLHLSATILDVQGAYSGSSAKMILCVAKKESVPHIEHLILDYPNCVVFKSIVNNSIAD